nr:MAG TPA: hypothetical protein [Caudoviricetes sp.]
MISLWISSVQVKSRVVFNLVFTFGQHAKNH